MPKLTIPAEAPDAPVQVLMPAGLLPRLPQMLAVIGMSLYQLPTKDGPTYLIGADLSQLRDPDAPTGMTTADVLNAWSLAVDSLTEAAEARAKRPKTRKRKVPSNAA